MNLWKGISHATVGLESGINIRTKYCAESITLSLHTDVYILIYIHTHIHIHIYTHRHTYVHT